jgi:hypothetical protein
MSTIAPPAEKRAGPQTEIRTEPTTGTTYHRCLSCGREHLSRSRIIHDDSCEAT